MTFKTNQNLCIDLATIRAVVDRVLKDHPSVDLAVIFGSAAREERSHRDVDIAIRIAADHSQDVTQIELSLGRALRCPVDLILLNTAPPLLRFEIARDAIPVVERTPGAWNDFRAHAMIDWWDWAPTARRMWKTAAQRLRDGATRIRVEPPAPGETLATEQEHRHGAR